MQLAVPSGTFAAEMGEQEANTDFEQTKQEAAQLSRKFSADSMVLLKNDNDVLPLKKGSNAAFFGRAQIDLYTGVFGSASHNAIFNDYVNAEQEFAEDLNLDQELLEKYHTFVQENPIPGFDFGVVYNAEMELDDETVQKAAEKSDTAVIFIGRSGGEEHDWTVEDEYQLRDVEKQMIEKVSGAFEHVAVILNTACAIDMTWDSDQIDAVLWVGLPGREGAKAIRDVVMGDVTPSGKLTQTWCTEIGQAPTLHNFDVTDKENQDSPEGYRGVELHYEEDIYMGYRYYDTFNVTPKYPFGYGLSYTDFVTEIEEVTADEEQVTVKATVTNIGDTTGKEVVQIYYSCPDGKLEKAYQELAAFAKTDLLEPGESEIVTMTYQTADMSSYDEEMAQYILEEGDYIVRVGNSSRNTHVGAVLELGETVVTEQLSNQMEIPEEASLETITKEGVTPYGYEGEEKEIEEAQRIKLAPEKFEAENHASQMTDQPEELETIPSILTTTEEISAVQESEQPVETVQQTEADETNQTMGLGGEYQAAVPAKITGDDIKDAYSVAGYVVNTPSTDGEDTSYETSITVEGAEEGLFPIRVEALYDGTYCVTVRYKTVSYLSDSLDMELYLQDQDGRKLGSIQIPANTDWTTGEITGVDLTGVETVQVISTTENTTIGWMDFQSEEYAGRVSASLNAGTYGDAVDINLICEETPDAEIYYTLDGSQPNEESNTYKDSISITENTILRAIASKEGKKNGIVSEYSYTIDSDLSESAEAPQANLESGAYNGTQTITLKADADAQIFYTVDGSEPGADSLRYEQPFEIRQNCEIKAIAIQNGKKNSDVMEKAYQIHAGNPEFSEYTETTLEVGSKIELNNPSFDGTIHYEVAYGEIPADPTADSPVYTEPITLDQAGKAVIKAYVTDSDLLEDSEIVAKEYNVTEHLLTSFDILSGDATAEEVVAQMTLEEMAQIVCGAGASEKYRLKGIQNRGEYTDGSQGMKVDDYTRWASNSLLACSWDTELFAQQGVCIAKDGTDQETKVDFWLAPGMNLMRDPRGGRNGEYYSEDPLLTGVYGTIMIKTVQESGIAVCPKHFVANDSENERHTMMVLVSERALRELYLKPFEMAVKQAQPKGLMTAFNDINRYSGASNFDLCTNIARGEWGFEGLIMTDWDSRCHQSTMVYAGNDLIMPSGNAELILDYIRNPRIMPTGDNSLDPYYVRPTTKGMLQRNTVRIVEILSQCPSTIRMMQEEGSKI